MEVEDGWHVKSNKQKVASSPNPLNKPGRAASPTPWEKSFKEVVVLYPDKGASALGNIVVSNWYSMLGNPLFRG
jgi:hypothetical protein